MDLDCLLQNVPQEVFAQREITIIAKKKEKYISQNSGSRANVKLTHCAVSNQDPSKLLKIF